ncbi:MAG: permease-like cell division protein FtsX [Streptococcaceae bacterium]|jgi:cell division transport system permease protein|nr:permease-like cell division protein FtsX [Streptococcaceae bacterium]
MIRIFFRHVWDSLKNIRRNGWMTVAAVSSVTITLFLVGIFLGLILNTQKLANDLANNVRVVAYIKLESHDNSQTIPDPKNSTKTIANPDYHKILNEIKTVPNVKAVTFSSKDQELDKLTKSLGPVWNLFKGSANPLYDSYVIEATSHDKVKEVSAAVSKLDGITKVDYGGVSTTNLFNLANMVRTWGTGLALLLILIAMFLISNTIRLTIISRSREIQIMRLVGAKNSYIRWPFFLEGAWVGLLGAILPTVAVIFIYGIIVKDFGPGLESSNLHLLPEATFIPQITLLLFAIGIVIGSLGATLSMRRYLKA